MLNTNQRHRPEALSIPPMPEWAAMRSFYTRTDDLVPQQHAAALEHELKAALFQVRPVEGDCWEW